MTSEIPRYCCYFKRASTRCKAIPIAFPHKFRISQYRRRLLLFTSFYVQFNIIKIRLFKSINRSKRGTKQTSFNVMCRTVTSFYFFQKLTCCSFFDKFLRRSSVSVKENTVLCQCLSDKKS